MNNTSKVAAIYARVSSDKQDTDLSISAQLRALREYAERNGYQVVREFIDEAESGRTAARPAFGEMIALSKTKEPPFATILVWKLNRFSRSRADSITYKTLLRNKGIEVISINEPVDDSPTGRLLEGVIESIDEFYSENLGQDIRRGMRENASRGFFNGSRPPYGFHVTKVNDGERQRNKLEPDSPDSVSTQTVKRMFDMALKDKGCKEIAKTLNRDGFRTGAGQRWGRTTVHKVLSNPAYAGVLLWGSGRGGHRIANHNDSPIRVENAWSAIIDRRTFELVQKIMAAKRPREVHPRTVPSFYLLSGMLYCSCGAAMTGHSAKSSRYYYYSCSRHIKQGSDACGARRFPKEKLECLVIDHLRSEILVDDHLEKLVTMVNEELQSESSLLKERLDVIDAGLNDTRSRLSKLYDALETGKIKLDDLTPRIRELKSRQEDLNKARVQIEAEMVVDQVKQVDLSTVKSYARDLRMLLQESEITERKAFIRSFVKRIVIGKDQVTLHYRLPIPCGVGKGEELAVLPIGTVGGAGGTRTLDLLTASQTFSQLNYGP